MYMYICVRRYRSEILNLTVLHDSCPLVLVFNVPYVDWTYCCISGQVYFTHTGACEIVFCGEKLRVQHFWGGGWEWGLALHKLSQVPNYSRGGGVLFLYLGINRRTTGMGHLLDQSNISMGCNFHQSVMSIGR
jgi:hypothetical protein